MQPANHAALAAEHEAFLAACDAVIFSDPPKAERARHAAYEAACGITCVTSIRSTVGRGDWSRPGNFAYVIDMQSREAQLADLLAEIEAWCAEMEAERFAAAA